MIASEKQPADLALIPRESLPAVPKTKGARREAAPTGAAGPLADAGRQLPIFGAESSEASPLDLVGLLLGPGRLERMGRTARVSVPVDAAWRVHVLVAELVTRGLVVTWRAIDRPHEVAPTTAEAEVVARGESRGTPRDAQASPDESHIDFEDVVDDSPASRPIGAGTRESPVPDDQRGPDMRRHDWRPQGRAGDDSLQLDPESPESTPKAQAGEPSRPDERATAAALSGPEGSVEPRAPGESAEVSVLPGNPTHGDEPDEEDTPGPAAGPPPVRLLYEVRTAYSSRLNALADAWPTAADQLFLAGPRLRLWVAAAGRRVDGGYALGLGETSDTPPDATSDRLFPGIAVDAALRRAGLDRVVSDQGRDYLISGRKPLQRLAELVGERPAAAPDGVWPGGASA